jgi:hypothetical protein
MYEYTQDATAQIVRRENPFLLNGDAHSLDFEVEALSRRISRCFSFQRLERAIPMISQL